MNVSEHFTDFELGCGHCAEMEVLNLGPWGDESNLDTLESLRVKYGRPMRINSGFRCPEHPIEAAKSNGPGSHCDGLGLDVGCYQDDALLLTYVAYEHGWHGIRWQQKDHVFSRFVHIDRALSTFDAPRPHAGSY